MKQSENVKAKIAAGYLLLVAVCCAAIGYVWFEVSNLSRPDTYREQLHQRRGIVNQVLYHLYQAESYGQLMTAGYSSYEPRYKGELRTVRGYIDTLRTMTAASDSLQAMRLDSIEWLVRQKERGTVRMRNSLRAGGTAGLLSKNIENLLPTDSLALDTIRRPTTVVSRDTVRIRRKRRGFFRRLGDLFSPPKEDTAVRVTTQIVVDSLPVSVTDTIAGVLRSLEQRVTDQRLAIYEQAWQEGILLRRNNQLVNEQIYRLITAFEQDETAYLTARYHDRTDLRRRSSFILGTIAAASILLVLLFVAILWRDIGRSNRYKRRLEEANRANEALLSAREKMMLAITHDIKAPLGSIMGYIDLLERLTSQKRESLYLSNMRSSADHLLALVDDLLDFYRLEANKVEANSVPFNPAHLFAAIAGEFSPQARSKGVALTTDIAPEADRLFAGDPFRIRQITDNLLSNALKFTDRGQVTLSASILPGHLVFTVRDTGRGMSREEQERIFGEFVRLRSAAGVDGFGLGLSIVDRLVRLLGGTISVESQAGKGSKFIVCLPLKDAADHPQRDPDQQKPLPCAALRCLIVDDDPLQSEMTAAMCRSLGADAVCCPYPEHAPRVAAEQDFDLLLTDIQMPLTDGFRLLELIRVDGKNASLPAIAVTARSDNRREDYLNKGFSDVLRKPFSRSELAAVLGSVCPALAEAAKQPPGETTPGQGFGALTAFAKDDRAAAAAILRSFSEQQTANAAALRAAAAAGDGAAIGALAHKMLPIFTMIGRHEVVAALRRLERLPAQPDAAWLRQAEQLAEKVDAAAQSAQKELSLSEKE